MNDSQQSRQQVPPESRMHLSFVPWALPETKTQTDNLRHLRDWLSLSNQSAMVFVAFPGMDKTQTFSLD